MGTGRPQIRPPYKKLFVLQPGSTVKIAMSDSTKTMSNKGHVARVEVIPNQPIEVTKEQLCSLQIHFKEKFFKSHYVGETIGGELQ